MNREALDRFSDLLAEWYNPLSPLPQLVRDLIEERKQLYAVIDRLPKTKDGVHVIPGIDQVYHDSWGPNTTINVVGELDPHYEFGLMRLEPEPDEPPKCLAASYYFEEDTGANDIFIALVSDCYSTQKAAEQAAKEGDR